MVLLLLLPLSLLALLGQGVEGFGERVRERVLGARAFHAETGESPQGRPLSGRR